MACHTPPLKKSKEMREDAIAQLSHIPLQKFMDGMGPRLGNGISPCFFPFLRGGICQAITKSRENLLLLVGASVSEPHIYESAMKFLYLYLYIFVNHLQFLFSVCQLCVGRVHILQDTLRTCPYVKCSVYFNNQC